MTEKKNAAGEQQKNTENSEENTTDVKITSPASDSKTDSVKASVEGSPITSKTSNTQTKTNEKPLPKSMKTTSKQANQTKVSSSESDKPSSSKSGPLALMLSIIAIAGIGGHYFWQTQQHQLLAEHVLNTSQNQQQANEKQLLQSVNQQQNVFSQQLSTQFETAMSSSNEKVAQLTQQLNSFNQQIISLSQNQPSDWLLHEAEYLIRVASRSLWLEKDTKIAITLLNDANERLKELNDPSLLPVRQLINQDIETLRLQPTLATDDVILTIMGLMEQIDQLPIAMVYLPDSEAIETNIELSHDANDWQANLAKSWHKFMEDFITVRRRTANVEPLLSPKQQQNLRQNIHLKLQLAQWGASQQKDAIYQQSLSNTQDWLTEYFDTDEVSVKQFIAQIEKLKSQTINIELPAKLLSLAAIRAELSQKSSVAEPEPIAEESKTVIEESPVEQENEKPVNDDNDEAIL